MKSSDAKEQFERHVKRAAGGLRRLSPSDAVRAVLDFYRSVRVEDCDITTRGDMLLFQWGTYDWGKGEHFEFDMTRQFVGASGEDEDIWQLSLTFRFTPEVALRELASGNRWCHGLDELSDFESFVGASRAYLAVATRSDVSPELDFQCAG